MYIQKKKKTTLKLDIIRFEKTCSVCYHKLNRPLKRIPCTTCKSLVHRKCRRLKISEITEVLKTKEKIENWECPSCKKAKFPFCDLDNLVIEKEVFNSHFPYKCSRDTNFTTERGKFTFIYKPSEENGDKKTNLSKINEFLDEHVLIPSFEYYQTHDFHKFSAKTTKEKTFSLMHTNICSLNANIKHLDNLLDQLDFSFHLLAVSETWTAKSDHVKNIP